MLITVMINVIKTVSALAEINIKKTISLLLFLLLQIRSGIREAELLSEVLIVKIFELFRKDTTTVTTRTTTTTIIIINVFIKR